MEKNSVHVLYKKLGETPLEALERFKKDNPEYSHTPITYAGRLDPMAEGVLLALSGESISKKQDYLDLQKTYIFEVLWGFSTDSLDILGIVSGESENIPEQNIVKRKIGYSIGKLSQKYPVFSSKLIATKFKGRRFFPWTRPGIDEVSMPSHDVEIYDGSFISREVISGDELLKIIVERVSLVTGDFRQKETIENWKEVIRSDNKYIIDTLTLTVSRGFYVRQFVSDLAREFGTLGATFHIKRTQIGDYVV